METGASKGKLSVQEMLNLQEVERRKDAEEDVEGRRKDAERIFHGLLLSVLALIGQYIGSITKLTVLFFAVGALYGVVVIIFKYAYGIHLPLAK